MRDGLQRIFQSQSAHRRARRSKSKISSQYAEHKLLLEPLERRLLLTSVTGITRGTPSVHDTSASSVTFNVNFNTSVTGVDASDFRTNTSGALTVGSPLVVGGSGSAYTVTVNGVRGYGNLRLDLIDDDSIIDGALSTLGGAGPNNGSYQGQDYTIVGQAGPYVQSISRTTPASNNANGPTVVYTVTFNKDVANVDSADFATVLSGVTASAPVVTPVSNSVYTVTINGISGSGTLGLNLVDNNTIRDSQGLPLVKSTTVPAFLAQTTFTVGTSPITVAVADLRRNGNQDLIVANSVNDNVGVRLGNGNGTFQNQVTYATGDNPTFATAADVNGDGKLDLLVTSANDNTLSILLGNGDGTFQPRTTLSTGASPSSVAAVDLNGDGKVDLIETNPVDNNVSVFLNNGNNAFPTRTSYTSGGTGSLINVNAYYVAVADLNGDNRPDMVVANPGSANNVSVFINNGSGGFASQVTYTSGGSGPISLALADIDNDGDADLLMANSVGNNVGVRFNNGAGVFSAVTAYAAGTGPASIAMSDVNLDGKPDMVVTDGGDNSGNNSSMSVLLGNGNGTFQARVNFVANGFAASGVIGDLNNDGRPDIVDDNFQQNNVGLYLNNTNGNFTGEVYSILSIPVVDLNGPAAGANYAGVFSAASGAVPVADASQATITSAANVTSIKLTLTNVQAGDVLSATTTGTSIAQTFTAGVLTLSGSDSAAHYQQVLRSVLYNNTIGVPGVAAETVAVVATDINNVNSTEADATITIDTVTPTTDLSAPGGSTGQSSSWTSLAVTAISITDPAAAIVDSDSANLSQVTVSIVGPSPGDALTAAASGGVSVSGDGTATIMLSGSASTAAYSAVLATLEFNTTTLISRTVTVNVVATDDGLLVGNTAVAAITVDPAAPVVDLNGDGNPGSGYSNNWTNTGAVPITDPTASVSDADSANLTQVVLTIASPSAGDALHASGISGVTVSGNDTPTITLSGAASAAAYSGVLTGVTFNSTTLANRTVSINVQAIDDGGLASNAATSTINVLVDLPPVLDLNTSAPGTGFTANWVGSNVLIVEPNAGSVTDTDSTNLTQLIVKIPSFHTGDVLSATTTGTTITQTYSNGTLTLSGSDTVAHYQQVLRTVTYNNTAGGPGVNSFPVTFVANDGTTTSGTVTATVQAPPVIRLNAVNGANFSTTWYNNGNSPSGLANGAVALGNMAQATVTDGAGLANISSMTVALTTFVAGDVLTVPIVAGVAITATYSDGTLTLSGNDTLAHYQQELRLISYNNTNNGPGVTQKKATFVASDGTVTGNAITSTINISLPTGTQVLANRLFYNNSRYDGHTPTGTVPGDSGVNSFDDAAIASDKTGLVVFANGASVPGTATFANVSSFSKGITGVIIDVVGGIGTHSLINRSSGDITFKVAPTSVGGTYNQLSTWTGAVPTPASISVRVGAGIGGSDRIEITWAATLAVKNNWLEINLKSTANTGLTSDYAFIYGSDIGNSGLNDPAGQSKTEAFDGTAPTTNNLGLTTQVFQILDYDKDGQVNATDSVTASSNNGQLLVYLRNPTGPYAPDGGAPSASPAAVAAALPATSALSSALVTSLNSPTPIKLPAALAGRLENLLHSPPVEKLLHGVSSSASLQSAVDQILSRFHVKDDALDGLLRDLGLE